MKRLAILFGLALLVIGPLSVSSAANAPLAGNLDRSFGKGAVVIQSLGSIGGIAVQPDGKIVVAGGGAQGFRLARYLPNGSPDASFGDGGYVETSFTYGASAEAIALQPDGKIVVAGRSSQGDKSVLSEFTLARYGPNGSLDTSFGTDGITNTVIPEQPGYTCPFGLSWSAAPNALAILPGGDILAAGSAGWSDGCGLYDNFSSFALARYTPSGSLDPTFGTGGIVQTSFDGWDGVTGIAVQPDGKIVASGTAGSDGPLPYETMALARYNPDGSLDGTFGTAGKVTPPSRLFYSDISDYRIGGPPILQHGKILEASATSKGGTALARYDGSGRLDSTFGKHGVAEIKRQIGLPTAVLAQNDGKILIAETSPQEGSAVVRLLPNGRLDTHFGKGGSVSFDNYLSSLALQTDGKILVLEEGSPSGNAWALSRLMGGNNCVVPDLRGKTVSKASAGLEASYCRPGTISKRFSSKVARGRVISTAPPQGARLPGGARIHLVVSKG